jgi:hypothetical protein
VVNIGTADAIYTPLSFGVKYRAHNTEWALCTIQYEMSCVFCRRRELAGGALRTYCLFGIARLKSLANGQGHLGISTVFSLHVAHRRCLFLFRRFLYFPGEGRAAWGTSE